MRVASVEAPSFVGDSGRWTELADVRVELATPMLGGGSRAGFPDLDQPFRPSAVRGALRRWWRATNVFASPEDLRQRERRLWGMADSDGGGPASSRVRVEVNTIASGDSVILRSAQGLVPDYAKGILIEPERGPRAVADADAMRILRSGTFELTVSVRSEQFGTEDSPSTTPNDIDEVRRALAAWLLFGGIGARTRRGFGALKWFGFEATTALAGLNHEKDKWDRLTDDQHKAFLKSGFTSLVGARLFLKDANGPIPAWREAIGTLRDFRKGQKGRLRPGQGPESHSPWPEADSLRVSQRREPWVRPPKPTYPRAELGLPLQIRCAPSPAAGQFKSAQVPGTNEKTRLASPVMVKPVYWNGSWRAGFLLMTRGRLEDIETDATGYPRNIYGVPAYSGTRQTKDDILDLLSYMLGQPTLYGYNTVPLP